MNFALHRALLAHIPNVKMREKVVDTVGKCLRQPTPLTPFMFGIIVGKLYSADYSAVTATINQR